MNKELTSCSCTLGLIINSGDYDYRYMLALFIANMQALSNEGWRLPPGITVNDLNDINNIINTKFPPPKND